MSRAGVKRMLADIRSETALARRWLGRDTLDPRVLEAMARVPRDRFVPEELRDHAWDNGPLPIGHGQTISQPFIVALMTDLLDIEPHHRILEIGTGSGYQTAILAELADQVYTVEVVPPLGAQAKRVLDALGYENIHYRTADGHLGWPEHAPYDGIIVTAAAREIPEELIAQLKPGGRLVIPVGPPWTTQQLRRLTRREDGTLDEQAILPVAFVPLVEEDAGHQDRQKP